MSVSIRPYEESDVIDSSGRYAGGCGINQISRKWSALRCSAYSIIRSD